jgi:hypothetical protein
MELHFMVLAILLLTLVAAYAIRRAEKEMIERHDLDRRARTDPPTQGTHEIASGTKARA